MLLFVHTTMLHRLLVRGSAIPRPGSLSPSNMRALKQVLPLPAGRVTALPRCCAPAGVLGAALDPKPLALTLITSGAVAAAVYVVNVTGSCCGAVALACRVRSRAELRAALLLNEVLRSLDPNSLNLWACHNAWGVAGAAGAAAGPADKAGGPAAQLRAPYKCGQCSAAWTCKRRWRRRMHYCSICIAAQGSRACTACARTSAHRPRRR